MMKKLIVWFPKYGTQKSQKCKISQAKYIKLIAKTINFWKKLLPIPKGCQLEVVAKTIHPV